jgi:hypothetical protein
MMIQYVCKKFNIRGKFFSEFLYKISARADGVLAPGSAHAGPSARPPSTLADIFRHACLQRDMWSLFGDLGLGELGEVSGVSTPWGYAGTKGSTFPVHQSTM